MHFDSMFAKDIRRGSMLRVTINGKPVVGVVGAVEVIAHPRVVGHNDRSKVKVRMVTACQGEDIVTSFAYLDPMEMIA